MQCCSLLSTALGHAGCLGADVSVLCTPGMMQAWQSCIKMCISSIACALQVADQSVSGPLRGGHCRSRGCSLQVPSPEATIPKRMFFSRKSARSALIHSCPTTLDCLFGDGRDLCKGEPNSWTSRTGRWLPLCRGDHQEQQQKQKCQQDFLWKCEKAFDLQALI